MAGVTATATILTLIARGIFKTKTLYEDLQLPF